ncbi:MAG: hypothetical protein GF383_15435 [Candidatus Lokiarchaeota archaeon]|nr:hypothetical protein [Candidatus Lokiarchaeota archaeon]MBD3342936.1 hypothetical protein [Candidatus Lokiarchaeota archaeon]
MKGILVLSFNEDYEPFIEAQYPSDLSQTYKIKPSDLMNIYTLHRMNRKEPNFYQMEIKEFTAASFFTGFSYEKYVGHPNYAITIILDKDELNNGSLSGDLEGNVRRIAHDALAKRSDEDFDEIVKKYFVMLKNADLAPYWEEHSGKKEEETLLEPDVEMKSPLNKEEKPPKEILPPEKEIFSVEKSNQTQVETKAERGGKLPTVTPPPKPSIDTEVKPESNQLDARFMKLEKEVIEAEIKELKSMLNEKNGKIRELTDQIDDQTDLEKELESWKVKYQNIEGQKAELTEEVNNLTEEIANQKEELEVRAKKLSEFKEIIEQKEIKIQELNQQYEEMHGEVDDVVSLRKEIEELKENIKDLKNSKITIRNELDRVKKDNNIHIDTILKLREVKTKDEKLLAENKEQIIELKKEIKVLRRERDHYKQIIKENDLL